MNADRTNSMKLNEAISRLTVRAASHLALIGLGNPDVTAAHEKGNCDVSACGQDEDRC